MDTDTAPTIVRGYAKNASDEKRLRDFGIKTVYRAHKGETPGKAPGQFRMRKGELLGVVGLGAFGDTRKAIADMIDLLHSWGAAVVDIERPGLRSDRDGVRLLHIAMTPQRNLSPEAAAELAAKSKAARTAGRMPEHEARRIWFDGRYSVAEKVQRIHGWSQRALYDKFKATNAGAGRRPK